MSYVRDWRSGRRQHNPSQAVHGPINGLYKVVGLGVPWRGPSQGALREARSDWNNWVGESSFRTWTKSLPKRSPPRPIQAQ